LPERRKQLRFGAFFSVPGCHPTGWRHRDAVPECDLGFRWLAHKARQDLVVRTARERGMTLREIARHTAAGTGHRVLVGTAEYMADEMQAWLDADAADGFNVICNYYHAPFEEFSRQVIPELQRRGVFRTEYEGPTLRQNLGLRVPENRYTLAR